VSQRTRLRGQDGFIRDVIWIAVILLVIAVVILDGMAIFRAYQSADDATSAAEEALTEYAQTTDVTAAKLAAAQYLAKSDIEMTSFEAVQTANGTVKFTVTATASADTYVFSYLGKISPLKDWVERTTHPTRTGSAE
jgi:Flp pilus assembly protein TadG